MSDPDLVPMEQLIVLFGADQAAVEDAAAAVGVPVAGGIARTRIEAVRSELRRRAIEGA
ncbi:MAG: hypothetical protein ACI38R_11070 [Rhodococcus sp. (in: high G+C Gram-positive bacteria)]